MKDELFGLSKRKVGERVDYSKLSFDQLTKLTDYGESSTDILKILVDRPEILKALAEIDNTDPSFKLKLKELMKEY